MRNKIFLITAFTLGFGITMAQKKGYTIAVKIAGFKQESLYMQHMEDGVNITDSVKSKKGVFTFSGRVGEPADMVIIYSPVARFRKIFYLENKSIEITGSADDLNKLTVKGSLIQDEYAALEKQVDEYRLNVQRVYNQAEEAKQAGMQKKADSLTTVADNLYRGEVSIHKDFVVNHPKSFAALNELMNLITDSNVSEMKLLYAKMDEPLKATSKAKEIVDRIQNLELTKVGNNYIDFTMNDLNGNQVALSSYKGKYVLLEFWASWCGPCRGENPNLREQYSKYNSKGLNILGVSLDSKAEPWKKAVEKDQLPWVHVSDLKGWNNSAALQYGVRAVPANFLISPDGKIIARDLRGEELNKKLALLFE